jgi:hypothetical protein
MTRPDADLRDLLKLAADVVEQADLPSDLRVTAFERALRWLDVGTADTPRLATSGDRPSSTDERPNGSGKLHGIARRLQLESDRVAEIYEEENDEVRLILKRAMLPEATKKAASMRDVALLVVVGRQASGLEEFTAYDSIREECRELKVYDPPNFASEVAKIEFRTRGGRNSKEAKANRHHYDEAADLIRRMTAGDSS